LLVRVALTSSVSGAAYHRPNGENAATFIADWHVAEVVRLLAPNSHEFGYCVKRSPASKSSLLLQLKQLPQSGQQRVRCSPFGLVAQRFEGRVQQLVDQAIEGAGDFVGLAGVDVAQLVDQP
jgi:hypothetical protein